MRVKKHFIIIVFNAFNLPQATEGLISNYPFNGNADDESGNG
jgi:hypothetical protein